MPERLDVYKCDICGNIVEVLHGGVGELVCCEQPMEKLTEQTADSANEKHVPVAEKTSNGILVKVGSVPHPMIDKHFIEWIELVAGDAVHRAYLNPDMEPEVLFDVDADSFFTREYCNIHGLWKG